MPRGQGGLRSRRRREIGRRTTHLQAWLRVEIPARRGAILGAEVPWRVKGPWRSCGAAKGGLGCGGVAWPRRRKGFSVAERVVAAG